MPEIWRAQNYKMPTVSRTCSIFPDMGTTGVVHTNWQAYPNSGWKTGSTFATREWAEEKEENR